MNVDELIAFFNSTRRLCESLEVTPGAISQWRKAGIPRLRQFQIEVVTGGHFVVPRRNKSEQCDVA